MSLTLQAKQVNILYLNVLPLVVPAEQMVCLWKDLIQIEESDRWTETRGLEGAQDFCPESQCERAWLCSAGGALPECRDVCFSLKAFECYDNSKKILPFPNGRSGYGNSRNRQCL